MTGDPVSCNKPLRIQKPDYHSNGTRCFYAITLGIQGLIWTMGSSVYWDTQA